jgi:predicted transcriptional regulator
MAIVGNLMTRERLVTIGPSTLTSAAARRISDEGVSHLMVTDGDSLLGVFCVCDIDAADVGSVVSECMTRNPVSVRADTDAADAAQLMHSWGVSCLPVLVAGKLYGVVTLSDLRAAGIVESAVTCCTVCGSEDHVRCTEHGDCVALCLECTRKSEPPDAEEELGGGGE